MMQAAALLESEPAIGIQNVSNEIETTLLPSGMLPLDTVNVPAPTDSRVDVLPDGHAQPRRSSTPIFATWSSATRRWTVHLDVLCSRGLPIALLPDDQDAAGDRQSRAGASGSPVRARRRSACARPRRARCAGRRVSTGCRRIGWKRVSGAGTPDDSRSVRASRHAAAPPPSGFTSTKNPTAGVEQGRRTARGVARPGRHAWCRAADPASRSLDSIGAANRSPPVVAGVESTLFAVSRASRTGRVTNPGFSRSSGIGSARR